MMMNDKVTKVLKNGGVAVLLTDTLYGVCAQALNKKAVERVYKIKGRNDKKPLIILISAVEDLLSFSITLDEKTKKIISSYWPGPVSIILPCPQGKFTYLHRGTQTLAFRLPKRKSLNAILRATGPLVAPSANPEGALPAKNVAEAQNYFGNNVDLYLKGGAPKAKPSMIIKIENGKIETIRK